MAVETQWVLEKAWQKAAVKELVLQKGQPRAVVKQWVH